MEVLEAEEIKKLKKGVLLGNIATGLCGAVLVYFAVCFPVAQTLELDGLRLAVLITAPVLMALFAAAAAFCNLKYGKALERKIDSYVQGVLVENAPLLHPERGSLTYHFNFGDNSVTMTANNYKEKIIFDFSAFGKLTTATKSTVSSSIVKKLCETFCRLYERGAKYVSVAYKLYNGKNEGKLNYIINGGTPDKKTYKNYCKTK